MASKTAGKRSKNTSLPSSPEVDSEYFQDKENVPKSNKKAHPGPPNVDECEYVVALLVTLDGRHVFRDMNMFKLGKFPARDWDTKAINKVEQMVSRLGKEIDQCSSIATITGARKQPIDKDISDPDDWSGVDNVLRAYFKVNVKALYVDYRISYISKRSLILQQPQNDVIDLVDDELSDGDVDAKNRP